VDVIGPLVGSATPTGAPEGGIDCGEDWAPRPGVGVLGSSGTEGGLAELRRDAAAGDGGSAAFCKAPTQASSTVSFMAPDDRAFPQCSTSREMLPLEPSEHEK
jgi:hypothetical protein